MDPMHNVEENLAGTVEAEASVLLDEQGEPIAAIVELPENEEITNPVSDAVAIAEIDANKEITIAALHVDAAIASTEAHTEIESARIELESERETQWQSELNELRMNIAELETTMMTLSAALANPSSPTVSPEAEEPLVIVDPETLMLASTSDPMPEIATEATLSDAGESLAEIIAPIIAVEKPRRRLI
jgi:hypothetical protein